VFKPILNLYNDCTIKPAKGMTNYKETLNLPNTGFPMKASLPNREPSLLEQWDENNLYLKIRQQQAGKEKFLLLDGPPYANGKIHIGHAVNKVLKDIVIKSKTLSGFDAPYLPGWDCHGLPIEHQVEKKKGKVGSKLDASQYREACRDYALQQVSEQRDDFIRLGILGQWEKPYLTLDRNYEAEQIRAFAMIVKNGHLIYGHKPVHWCLDCKSALAEAEVEYKEKESSAVDVRFRIIDTNDFLTRTGLNLDQTDLPIYLPIWTTTLWTLPANQAVVLGENLNYLLIATQSDQGPHCVIVAEGLQESIRDRWQAVKWDVIGSVNPKDLKGLQLQHPFYERQVPTLIGDYVTLEAGTGAVHTAPAHGHDDFIIGQKNDLPLENPVDDFGIFTESTEYFAGQHVFKVESSITEKLLENNNLIHQQAFIHSYPHCWRHKTPLIFRATPQWFISMDQMNLRTTCLDVIETVEWMPDWGKKRIQGMVESRPDWCISRQRFWGVPIPLFIHKETESLHPNTVDLLHQVANKIEEHGIDGWFLASTEDFLGEEATEYYKTTDTMDVWMDSGLAHYAVSENHTNVDFPADLYLEGSDQHRGWFQSSLLTSVAMNAKAPYQQVLTHGFTVDEDGKKMSKSLGNVIAPQAVINNLGADILRLWAASTDYSSEMSISDQILKRNSDAYRRIRNTARFLLGNLNDFDPNKDLLPVNELLTLDQWIINRLHEVQTKILEDYHVYAFHHVSQSLHNFCVVDMGGFYLDVIKDRLYTTEDHSHARKSAQTVLYHTAEAMVRWIAPILSFTADEIWQYLPGDRAESVFLSEWHQLPTKADIDVNWSAIDVVQQTAAKALEVGRNEGVIGSSLDASITIYADDELADLLASFGEELHFLFITSEATLASAVNIPQGSVKADGVAVSVLKSKHQKCTRCWHKDESVGQSSDHPELCTRCIGNITGRGELRLHF
jgi:isoleucyl-tRNA synthetase